ncbi:DUF86 domain-containing protein [Sulfurimonas sediminis]|uniref:DUF86 domain-containing protein n=1 Tax=Sulfurimonas sediminis TaxID=2590020 RepID=A0A7M1B3E6_9BACT|nr:HepT-like ribonuclease domain-containing protein [Sulfurimonas sediminis]QOP44251.1 DUF86 domain-containing protein [Sulfurimonas sediminis]
MLERLVQLEENISTLKELQNKISLDDVRRNKFDEWALRYGIFESIQIVIDISCHIAAKYNLGSSKSYVECIEKLEKFEYISNSLSKSLIGAIGLRNMLIHEYVRIDIEQLYSFLEYIDDFSAFAVAAKEVV